MWINVMNSMFVGIVVNFTICGTQSEKPKVLIAGLFPLSKNVAEGSIGRGVKPAVNLALKMINENDDILPDHELAIILNDTQVCNK